MPIGGTFGLFAVNLIAASLYEASRNNRSEAASIAPAAVTMLFLFNLIYATTWGMAAFLVPMETFPPEMRAQGNGFGITSWTIGVGWTVLINPIMFAHSENRTYFLFAGLNLLWIPIAYFSTPRPRIDLESINVMFAPSRPFFRDMEKAYAAGGDVLANYGGIDEVRKSSVGMKEVVMEA